MAATVTHLTQLPPGWRVHRLTRGTWRAVNAEYQVEVSGPTLAAVIVTAVEANAHLTRERSAQS